MAEQASLIGRTSQYFSDSVDELKKVSAPTRQETIQATVVTVIIVIFVAVVVAGLDLIFGKVMEALLV